MNINTPLILEDFNLWNRLNESTQVIIDTSKFIKTLFTDPMTLIINGIHAIQPTVMYTTLIVLAVIILLKMIGFKDMEKWGILTLILYIVVIII